jgi:hypothetical protein
VAKAALRLVDGTTVNIDGSPEEIDRILRGLESTRSGSQPSKEPVRRGHGARHKRVSGSDDAAHLDVAHKLVNFLRERKDAELIEAAILDSKSQSDRVLLGLFLLNEHLPDAQGMTSGELAAFTKGLHVPVSIANTSTALARSKLVMGDKARVKGKVTRYKLTRRGIQHIRDLIGST